MQVCNQYQIAKRVELSLLICLLSSVSQCVGLFSKHGHSPDVRNVTDPWSQQRATLSMQLTQKSWHVLQGKGLGGEGVSNVSQLAEDFPGFSTESLASQEPTQTIMICPGLFQLFKMESPMSWKPLFSEGKLGSLLPYQTGHVTAALPKWDEWRVYSRKLW